MARDASILPDISLDPVLTSFLSLDSSAALQHHFDFLQRGMSPQQQTAFNLNLTAAVGGSRVTYGGVGVVALALSMLFDVVAQQVGEIISKIWKTRLKAIVLILFPSGQSTATSSSNNSEIQS